MCGAVSTWINWSISQENRAPSVAMHEMQEDKVAGWEAGRANQKAEG